MWGVNCELSNDHPNPKVHPKYLCVGFSKILCAGLWRVRLLTCCSSCMWNSPAYLSLYMSQGVLSRDPFSLLSAGLLNRGRTRAFVPTLRLEQLSNKAAGTTEISAPQPREIRGSSVIEALKRGRRAGTGEAAQDETSGHRIFF